MEKTDVRNPNKSDNNKEKQIQNLIRQLENEKSITKKQAEEIASLNSQLYAVITSRPYKYAQFCTKIVRKFIPIGSKRALFCRLLWTLIRHPFTFFRNLKKGSIKLFFSLLKEGKIEEIGLRIKKHIYPHMFRNNETNSFEHTNDDVIDTPEVSEIRNKVLQISDYECINVPRFGRVNVSIVIPVYNQFEYTYHCVESIVRNSGTVSYEIIIADDCSTDITAEIDKVITGIKHIRNAENLRFLLNCNNAAKYALGKYVLFLNNDTQVCENWLEPLVSLIESNPDIGMVGSKLIYPDGRLQEAGGILWNDGSAWNYGNGKNPELPEFNYVKQVDYISGASIMLSKELWDDLGGFDPSFAPAYCEDSDLAFTVREKGYKVMYQPKSVVVHFEGKSNGTDTSSGLKHYQVVNQTKFYEKWKNELERHPQNGTDVFHARDCSYGKKTVLFVDHYVPTFDQDAGSRTVFQYLKLFVEKGYNVKFIGDNFNRSEPYTGILQQMGIEVLYGIEYARGWKDWIKENSHCFDYAFINRPHIAPPYIEFLRENTAAKLVYYGHDLAFLRLARESEITGDSELKQSSEEWKEKELEIMRMADMSYYPSNVEVEEIHKIDNTIRVKAIPAYIFDTEADRPYQFELRKDIMFIGGFNHRPNVDAAIWLAREIMPKVNAINPDIKVHVIGSHAPESVLNLANDNFIIEGFVTDEQLEAFYRECRISVVPLRYGAGIKGKVVEAMHYGIPVVTTSVGAEGIEGAENCISVIDDTSLMADEIVKLYDNEKCLADMSKKEQQYVSQYYSSTNAEEAIRQEFDM